jgi:hypothetical protein
VSLPAVTTRLYASDEVQYFSYLRSLYFDRDVSFENEYRYFYDHGFTTPGFHETFLVNETDTGRRVNYGTVGSALLWSPFYALADLWTRTRASAPPDGYGHRYLAAVTWGSALYGFIAVLLSIRAARTVLGGSGSLMAAAAVWVGTPLVFYMYVAPSFAHATSAFAVAVFVNVWLHVRRTWSVAGTFALGLCAGLLGLVREQDIFVALGPAIDFGFWVLKDRRPAARASLASAAAGVLGTALALTPQLIAYKSLNGYFGPASHVSRKMYWHAPHAAGVFASPEHGLIVWTPLVVLSIAGVVALAAGRMGQLEPALAAGGAITDRVGAGFPGPSSVEGSRPAVQRVGVCLALMVVSQIYVAGSVASWTVAGAFGQRRFVGLTIVFVLGLAALWRIVNRKVLGVVLAFCVYWNIALMAQFAIRMMDRQRLEPARNAYNAFVTLPLQLPSLTYRYLTNRESFYQQASPGDER